MASKSSKKSTTKRAAASQQIAAELHAKLTETVANLVTSDAWPKLLKAMVEKDGTELSRFSFNNMLMILMQCPEATAVATSKAWAARGRFPLKGTKSLRISSPITVKDERDPERTKVVGFRFQPEFDISQTGPMWQDPHNLMFITPALRKPHDIRLQGEAPAEMWETVAKQIEALGYTVERGSTGSVNGYTDPKTMTVRVNDQVSGAQASKTLSHELAHIMADHVDDMAEYRAHRGRMETVAESLAYMICAYFGLDSAKYSAPYLASWAGDDPEEIMDAVQSCGKQVLAMFRTFVKNVETAQQKVLQEV